MTLKGSNSLVVTASVLQCSGGICFNVFERCIEWIITPSRVIFFMLWYVKHVHNNDGPLKLRLLTTEPVYTVQFVLKDVQLYSYIGS